jgi:hypothetical protein
VSLFAFFSKNSEIESRKKRRVSDAKSKPFYSSTSEGKVKKLQAPQVTKAKFLRYQYFQNSHRAWNCALILAGE